MKLIDRLNEKLNYNQEMLILFTVLSFIFFIFSPGVLAVLFLGIAVAYRIYNRNDDQAYGYRVRDKIRGWFGR